MRRCRFVNPSPMARKSRFMAALVFLRRGGSTSSASRSCIGAAAEIASAVNELSNPSMIWPPIDLIVVARGGGSIEDLWEFNEEIVARAIAAALVPIVSAVGHEVDFTIADFVADLRAPTPSAAAELIVPAAAELDRRVNELTLCLHRCWQSFIAG